MAKNLTLNVEPNVVVHHVSIKTEVKSTYPSFCAQRFQIRGEMTQRDWYDSPKTLNLNQKTKRKLPPKKQIYTH